jgi:hypothetical protein
MVGRDRKGDYDLLLFGLLLGKPGVNDSIRTRWHHDSLVEPRVMGTKSMARQLRRCLEIPKGFSGYITFNFHNSRLSGLPFIEGADGSKQQIQLR